MVKIAKEKKKKRGEKKAEMEISYGKVKVRMMTGNWTMDEGNGREK